jgi:hypothetical protein
VRSSRCIDISAQAHGICVTRPVSAPSWRNEAHACPPQNPSALPSFLCTRNEGILSPQSHRSLVPGLGLDFGRRLRASDVRASPTVPVPTEQILKPEAWNGRPVVCPRRGGRGGEGEAPLKTLQISGPFPTAPVQRSES